MINPASPKRLQAMAGRSNGNQENFNLPQKYRVVSWIALRARDGFLPKQRPARKSVRHSRNGAVVLQRRSFQVDQAQNVFCQSTRHRALSRPNGFRPIVRVGCHKPCCFSARRNDIFPKIIYLAILPSINPSDNQVFLAVFFQIYHSGYEASYCCVFTFSHCPNISHSNPS